MTVNEKKPIPWSSVIGVGLIAAAQVAFGTAMICTGFGASFGMGVITEGVSDGFTALRIIQTR